MKHNCTGVCMGVKSRCATLNLDNQLLLLLQFYTVGLCIVVVQCTVWLCSALCGCAVHCATFNLISGHDREATVPTLQCRAVPIAKMSQHNFIFFSALIDTREEKTFLRDVKNIDPFSSHCYNKIS